MGTSTADALKHHGAKQMKGFKVDPDALIVDQSRNSRKFPHTESEIWDLARDIALHGQHQPVKIRKVNENDLELVWGFGRQRAVSFINQDETLRSLAQLKDGERMLLKVAVEEIDDLNALLQNIAENSKRKTTTIIDTAHQQQMLREEHDWSDDDIADYFGYGKPWVQRIKKLLNLSEEEQQLLHEGHINHTEADRLASLPEDERQKALQEAKKNADGNGKVDRSTLNNKVNNKRREQGKATSLNMSQFRNLIAQLREDEDEGVADMAKTIERVVKGEIGAKGFKNAVSRLRG